ncbi:hypothetical protein B0H19DRAFT_1370785 [Mycena capillaripes]|nr:hypothetical protein B0H19DRAFT_1370785 [Mycena capillaripes]
MFNFQLISVLAFCSSIALGATFPAGDVRISPDIIPINFIGPVAATQTPGGGGDTRLYFQNADGSIQTAGTSGPFTVGKTHDNVLMVPVGEAQLNTPLAAIQIGDTDNLELRLYFISPSNILSEYIWSKANNASWRGGPTCTDCITRQGFVVQTNRVLYAMVNTDIGNTAKYRVGFNLIRSQELPSPSISAHSTAAAATTHPWLVVASIQLLMARPVYALGHDPLTSSLKHTVPISESPTCKTSPFLSERVLVRFTHIPLTTSDNWGGGRLSVSHSRLYVNWGFVVDSSWRRVLASCNVIAVLKPRRKLANAR